MPVYHLSNTISFPSPSRAEPDGLLAVGGDLSVPRLVLAYQSGIFPWYSEGYPILWWSPDPRLVLFPAEFRLSRSMRRLIARGVFEVKYDTAFAEVIEACSRVPREGQDGTWITREMIDAYCALHQEGIAHSIETWHHGALVGGLYGIALGGCFFGESMFSTVSNSSKIALAQLVAIARKYGFACIDCQTTTQHLVSMGAREIRRSEFLAILRNGKGQPRCGGKWTGITVDQEFPS